MAIARVLRRVFFFSLWVVALPIAADAQAPARAEGLDTARVVRAANALLATLDEAQRRTVVYAFNDETQRQRWSNLPTAMVPRGGIRLREMTSAQRESVTALLSVVLSARGLEKVEQIMQADEVNKRGSGGARSDLFGKDLYYLSFLGKPSEKDPWMIQFGGHHLALNITIAGARGVLTPTLTGAQPAIYTLNGKTIRPLAAESDQAIALLNALDAQQRKRAILNYRVANLVLGPGEDGKTIQPEGLKVAAMNAQQKALLLELISQWTGILNEGASRVRMAQMKEDIEQTWFAWSGPTTVASGSNITAYYRIQGPHLVIEYAPQGTGEEGALHVHTMYRDPTNDYGRSLVSK